MVSDYAALKEALHALAVARGRVPLPKGEPLPCPQEQVSEAPEEPPSA